MGKLKKVVWIFFFLIGFLWLVIFTGVMLSSRWYFENGYARTQPEWVSDCFLKGRRALGYLVSPPSNDQMIEYFDKNREKFDQLILDYYGHVKMWYEYGGRLDVSGLWRFRLAEMGVDEIHPGGPFFPNSARGDRAFEQLGVDVVLIDRGGGIGKYVDARKSYVYAPDFAQYDAETYAPIMEFRKTGQYILGNDVPEACLPSSLGRCCSMRVMNGNWAVATCLNASTN